MSTRQDVKNAIKTALTGTSGVNSIYTYHQKQRDQVDFPSIVITLGKSIEKRRSSPSPLAKKFIEFTALLEVASVDTSDDGSGALDFDDTLDAIDAQLRKDVTLGGVVLAAGVEHITTTVAPPTLVNGQNIMYLAVKTFDVTVQVTG